MFISTIDYVNLAQKNLTLESEQKELKKEMADFGPNLATCQIIIFSTST